MSKEPEKNVMADFENTQAYNGAVVQKVIFEAGCDSLLLPFRNIICWEILSSGLFGEERLVYLDKI